MARAKPIKPHPTTRPGCQTPDACVAGIRGLCRKCTSPEVFAKIAEARRVACATPEAKARQSEGIKRAFADPRWRAAMSERQKAAMERRWAWCPPALRDDYRRLRLALGAAEARRAIEDDMRRAGHAKEEALA